MGTARAGAKRRPGPPGRERMVASAAVLIGSRGVDATSFSDVLASSRAPRGSIYYYFPAGKRQLVEDAVAWTAAQVLAYQRTCRARDPAGVLTHFLAFFRRSIVASECRAGCPVAAVAIGAYTEEAVLASAVRRSFRSWIDLLVRQLTELGVPPRAARRLAVTTLASIEGALLLCRAEGRVDPLDEVAEALRRWAPRRKSRTPTRR